MGGQQYLLAIIAADVDTIFYRRIAYQGLNYTSIPYSGGIPQYLPTGTIYDVEYEIRCGVQSIPVDASQYWALGGSATTPWQPNTQYLAVSGIPRVSVTSDFGGWQFTLNDHDNTYGSRMIQTPKLLQ
jgi:hypothetical protein